MSTTSKESTRRTYEEALGGESEARFWQKQRLVEDVLNECQRFLSLKVHNSVRVLFKLDLEKELAQNYPLPSPALVRMRISRIAGGAGDDLRCEWRIACATADRADSNISFVEIHHEKLSASVNHQAAWKFLETHFGVIVSPWRCHLPQVSNIHARIVLREPLGVLAILEGTSAEVKVDTSIRAVFVTEFTNVTEDSSLREA